MGFALGAIVALELLLALNPRWMRSTSLVAWRSKIEWLLEESPPPCARMVMGDSRVMGGLDPVIFDEAMGDGECTLNAGLPDSRVADHYFLLKRLIEAGRAPRVLINDMSPHSFHDLDKDVAAARLFTELVEWQDIRETWGLYPVSLLGRKAFSAMVPSYRNREGLRETLRSPFVRSTAIWFAQPRMPPESFEDKGRQAQLNYFEAAVRLQGGMSVYCERAPDHYPPHQWPAVYRADPVQLHFAEELIRLARDQGIRLLILNWPVSCRLGGGDSQFLSAHKKTLASLLSRYPDVVWLNPELDCHPNRDYCADQIHFTPDAARAWSLEAARIITEHTASLPVP